MQILARENFKLVKKRAEASIGLRETSSVFAFGKATFPKGEGLYSRAAARAPEPSAPCGTGDLIRPSGTFPKGEGSSGGNAIEFFKQNKQKQNKPSTMGKVARRSRDG